MSTPDAGLGDYRGQRYRVAARHDGRAWTGHYRLLGVSRQAAREAADEGRHQWTPLDPAWATQPEAERNATQAAHAAIDALLAMSEAARP